MMMQKVTIRDVAARAGVSYQTVSRVLNDRPDVSEETRERVKQIISELAYRPNRAAKSLAGKHSLILGAIILGFRYFGPAQLVAEAESAASEAGYDLLTDNIPDFSEAEICAAVERMEDWSVDGILINFEIPRQMLYRLNHIPFVQTEARVGTTLPSVFMDQEHGTRQAIQHLLNLGHTQICEIAGPMQIQAASASIRHDACQAALRQAGLQLVHSIQGDWSVDSGYHAARQLRAMGTEFTAIFAANDEMALGAICALREHGLSVPADVSVVGFDDIPVSAYVAPSLTTIRHSSADLGSEAIKYLVQLIDNPKSKPEQHVILPELVQRDSTAPLI